ncbi:amidase, partial [Planococcus sp. SIMBA_143]
EYTPDLKADGWKGARSGVDLAFGNREAPEERAIMDAAIEQMKALGATVVVVTIPQQWFESDVLCYGFKRGGNDDLSTTRY